MTRNVLFFVKTAHFMSKRVKYSQDTVHVFFFFLDFRFIQGIELNDYEENFKYRTCANDEDYTL